MPPLPPDEGARLDELEGYRILDTPNEPVFDRLAELCSWIFAAPISIVGLIDAKRHWFKGSHGVSLKENSRENAFCAHTILSDQVVCVGDASLDQRFQDIPPVKGFGIRYYAGAPLVSPKGFRIGTLCIFDFKPRYLLKPQEQTRLKYLAQLAMGELEYRRFKPAPLDPEIAAMVERFVHSCPSPLQEALEVASLVRLTDKTILSELVPNANAAELMEWLSSLSFFQIEEQGLFAHHTTQQAPGTIFPHNTTQQTHDVVIFPHDTIRQALRQLLLERPQRYQELFLAAKQFYDRRIKALGAEGLEASGAEGLEQSPIEGIAQPTATQQRWILDDLYLHRHHTP
jgi:hypothetical protein